MAFHVHGMVCTHFGVASNNRGASSGNMSTLQKCMYKGRLHTTVSAEAGRFGMRVGLNEQGVPCNRKSGTSKEGLNTPHVWEDKEFSDSLKKKFGDDDGMGYMFTTKAKGKEDKDKGSCKARTSRFSMNRAISLDPWCGDTSYNVASPGAAPEARTDKAAKMENQTPVMYGTEYHNTRYQYPWSITPNALLNPEYALNYITAISQLNNVGGNHARFLYDFSPDTILVRLTHDMSPRFHWCFESTGNGNYDAPELVRLVKCGDIAPEGLYVAGALVSTPTGQVLRELGCQTFEGVKAGINAINKAVLNEISSKKGNK